MPAQTKTLTITGWSLTGLFALFMAFDIMIKLIRLPVVGATLQQLGWPPEMGFTIGILELIAVALYLWPRTAVLGGLLMTAILGGAIATHLRLGNPLLSHTLFGVYLGLFMWGGLWLRSPALRSVFPYGLLVIKRSS
jgi:hypothetical protein